MASSLDAITGTGESIDAPGIPGLSQSDYLNRLSDILYACKVIHHHIFPGNRNYRHVISHAVQL